MKEELLKGLSNLILAASDFRNSLEGMEITEADAETLLHNINQMSWELEAEVEVLAK